MQNGARWVLVACSMGLNGSHMPRMRVSGWGLKKFRCMQRCVGVQRLWGVLGRAGRRAALSGFESCNFCACAQPSTRCGAVCAVLARNGVQ